MRTTLGALWICFASFSTIASIAAQPAPVKSEHPGDTALFEFAPGQFVYKSFPTLLRLYVFDRDRPGKSNCDDGCASAWPPLLVSASEKGPAGDWTIIKRDDGTRQWAYKNRPVYVRYHDFDPDASTEEEGFHLLVP
jgi:hypothetical protein